MKKGSLSAQTIEVPTCLSGFTSSSVLKGIESICSTNSIFLDIKWKNHDQRCRDRLSVFHHTKAPLHDLVEHGSSDFLGNFSVNMTPSMKFLFESLGQRRRSRSMNNLAELIEEYSLLYSSPMQWSFDYISGVLQARTLMLLSLSMSNVDWSFERTLMEGHLHYQLGIIDDAKNQVTAISSNERHNNPSDFIASPARICKAPLTQLCSKAVLISLSMLNVDWSFERTLMEGHLHFQLGIIDDAKNQVTAISSNERHNNPSDFIASPASICKAPLTQFGSKAVLIGNEVSEMQTYEEIPDSVVDNNPTNLSKPILNANCSMIKGQIKCQWKSGTPYFLFTVGDDCGEVYLSRPWKIKSSVPEGFDYMYLFHSRSVNKLDSDNYASDASAIHGKMKVSNCLTLNSDGSRTRETEFVLYSTSVKSLVKMQSSDSVIKKSKRLHKKVTSMFRPNHASKHKSTLNFHELSAQFDVLSSKCLSMFRNYDERDLINQFQNDCTPDLELAALVLKDNRQDSTRDAAIGGWGLKFLGRSTLNNDSHPSVPFITCEGNQGFDREKSSENLTVLVPAGLHGGPSTESGGPSAIIGRWRSGGHCDCGGWDVGCPLQVLSCSSSIKNSKELFKKELQDDSKSIDLFIEGTKKSESIIKMVAMNDDLYIIYFHPSLSALQTFSIGVAIIHAQSSPLAPHF